MSAGLAPAESIVGGGAPQDPRGGGPAVSTGRHSRHIESVGPPHRGGLARSCKMLSDSEKGGLPPPPFLLDFAWFF